MNNTDLASWKEALPEIKLHIKEFKNEMEKHKEKATQLIDGEFDKLTEDEIKFFSRQIVGYFNYVPASKEFMIKVKQKFGAATQINFTLQNFLTWHFFDNILIDYLIDDSRFEKFESCAVTDFDKKMVQTLKTVMQGELTIEQRQFFYFKHLAKDVIAQIYAFTKTEDELLELVSTLATKNEKFLTVNDVYQLQPFFGLLPLPKFLAYKHYLMIQKSRNGATDSKINVGEIENIFYKEHFKGLNSLKTGEVVVKPISDLNALNDYLETRQRAKMLFSKPDVELKAAYIQDEVVGVMGVAKNVVVNIHVHGDYRRMGIAKKLIQKFLESKHYFLISPIGDSLNFVKSISLFNPKTNIGLITDQTLLPFEKSDNKFKSHEIIVKDSDETIISSIPPHLQNYLNKFHELSDLIFKTATLKGEEVGYLICNKVKEEIAVIYVKEEYQNKGIGSILIKATPSTKVWTLETSQEGMLFWYSKAILANDGKYYYCNSSRNIKSHFRKHNLSPQYVKTMYLR